MQHAHDADTAGEMNLNAHDADTAVEMDVKSHTHTHTHTSTHTHTHTHTHTVKCRTFVNRGPSTAGRQHIDSLSSEVGAITVRSTLTACRAIASSSGRPTQPLHSVGVAQSYPPCEHPCSTINTPVEATSGRRTTTSTPATTDRSTVLALGSGNAAPNGDAIPVMGSTAEDRAAMMNPTQKNSVAPPHLDMTSTLA
jgi:hypothetical protein